MLFFLCSFYSGAWQGLDQVAKQHSVFECRKQRASNKNFAPLSARKMSARTFGKAAFTNSNTTGLNDWEFVNAAFRAHERVTIGSRYTSGNNLFGRRRHAERFNLTSKMPECFPVSAAAGYLKVDRASFSALAERARAYKTLLLSSGARRWKKAQEYLIFFSLRLLKCLLVYNFTSDEVTTLRTLAFFCITLLILVFLKIHEIELNQILLKKGKSLTKKASICKQIFYFYMIVSSKLWMNKAVAAWEYKPMDWKSLYIL